MSRFILGVTGASGAIYAARTLWHLQKLGHSVSLIFTEMGKSKNLKAQIACLMCTIFLPIVQAEARIFREWLSFLAVWELSGKWRMELRTIFSSALPMSA